MANTKKTLREILKTQRDIALPTEDLIHVLLPLMSSVAAIHSTGRVARLGPDDVFESDDGTLVLGVPDGVTGISDHAEVSRIQPHAGSALKIIGEYRVTVDDASGHHVADLRAVTDAQQKTDKPVYLVGYRCWEKEIGHHDELTDIFATGLIFASLACGLNFDDPEDVGQFSGNRSNLFLLNRSLHPVMATLIMEMTALNRHERATDMATLAHRFQTYRDQPVGLDIGRVLSETHGLPKRRTAVLSHLRDRLFDLSRRNRLIYFRPTQATVNLTVASVPIVMRIESIRGDQLCTWGGAFASDVLSGRKVPLSKWLRFEDQPYLPSALDRIMQESRRDRNEYGFSNLRLVVAFLHWHNLKEDPDERITSPLLWLPIELAKTKGVRDQYTLCCNEADAEFNPALRHHLRQLYNIELPETVDLNKTTLSEIHQNIEAQIHKTEPGVTLAFQDKPVIQLVHQKAIQRLRQFQLRRGLKKSNAEMVRPDFSYDKDDYRPLGLALFEKHVRPSPLPQRLAVGAPMPPSTQFMTEVSNSADAKAYSLGGSEGHRFLWEMDLAQITATNFNYKKMSLVRDYNQLIDTITEQPSFDNIFSIEPKAFETEVAPVLPTSQQWGVVPADSTQSAAIALARLGRSFIIQGPPGTGKSQTITNLIADFAARGKRVLFVCEKRAALDVVFHRLKQAGLDRLSCLVHDSQEDKKAFALDLKDCYERWGKSDPQLEHQKSVRQRTVDALDFHVGTIENFERSMGALPADTSITVRSLIRRLIALPATESDVGPKARERLPTPGAWDVHRDLANSIANFMSSRFGQPSLAGHPFALLSTAIVANEHCYAKVERFLADGQRELDKLETLDMALESADALLSGETLLSDAVRLARAAKAASDSGLSRNLGVFDLKSVEYLSFEDSRARIAEADKAHADAREIAKHWHAPLSAEDAGTALEQAHRQEKSVFRFLNGSWRRLKKTVQAHYDFSAHTVAPSVISVLEKLVQLHKAQNARVAERHVVEQKLGVTDIDLFMATRQELSERVIADKSLAKLFEAARASSDPAAFLLQEAQSFAPLNELARLIEDHLDFADEMTINDISASLREMLESLDDLPEILPFLRSVHTADPAVAEALRTYALSPDVLEALVIDEAVARVMRAEPALRRFNAAQLSASACRAAKAYDLLKDENASVIRATLHTEFLRNVKLSTMSVTQLDSEGKRFKKRYSTGRRELEHEFGKSMRFRSIRDLCGGDTGAVVNDLKPIWLMSPLSVSDTLPLEANLFDVVVFDEASQIPTEEAVPALCRASQVIVVGDEMQLPPTSFFSTALDEDDMQIVANEDGEKIAIVLDADSLLNQAAQNLPATMLAWHYRSRSEALISFSNAAFYDGRLVTIPDQRISAPAEPSHPVRTDNDDKGIDGVSRLLTRPLTFHHIADGLYEKRANAPEAQYIADMVRNLLARDTGFSIGIVAFSEAQQTEIESALETLAASDPIFAAHIEQEFVRENAGQFNGLFVKNLENVQGDERDVIILSICYAPGRDGRMVMNFGPINQRGGEKRLNVIFSRAKHHMAIVSTIHADAITNTHNDGARALRAFLSYASAQSSGVAEHAQTILAAVNPGAEGVFSHSIPGDPLRDAMAEQLRLRGHIVHESVGCASFRCDLAIVDSDAEQYALAILLDAGHRVDTEQVVERFVFRPNVLKSFGWRVIDIPSNDWLHNKDAVIEAIEAALVDAVGGVDDDPFGALVLPIAMVKVSPSKTTSSDLASHAEGAAISFDEFEIKQGGSRKFWKIAVSDCELTVVFGRIGTKGSTVTKMFESEARAKREATKLIMEKTQKGYLEVS
jgi:predicted DNA-binding WGR domain protein